MYTFAVIVGILLAMVGAVSIAWAVLYLFTMTISGCIDIDNEDDDSDEVE